MQKHVLPLVHSFPIAIMICSVNFHQHPGFSARAELHKHTHTHTDTNDSLRSTTRARVLSVSGVRQCREMKETLMGLTAERTFRSTAGWWMGKAAVEKLAKEMGSINVQPGNSGCSGATIFPSKMLLTLQCTTDICARIK